MATPPQIEDLSVVIPTIGRSALEGCLRSIRDGDAWPARLVVVDQGRRPEAERWVAALREAGMDAVYAPSTQRGPAAGRNRGFERTETRFIACTDDDCRVFPDWVERMAAALRTHPDAIVSGRVEAAEPEDGSGGEAPSLRTSRDPRVHDRPLLDRDPLQGNNMGFSRATLGRLGPMDERSCVQFAEDAEWSYRALRSGVPIVYAPGVQVAHIAWRDRRQLAATYRRYAYAQGGFYGIYIRRGDRFAARRAAYDFVRGGWMLVRGTATRNAEVSMMGRAYLRRLPAGLLAGLREPVRSEA